MLTFWPCVPSNASSSTFDAVVTLTPFDVPMVAVSVVWTSEVPYGDGGTKKIPLLDPLPCSVVTVMWPDVPFSGTRAEMAVDVVGGVIPALIVLMATRLFAAVVSKLVPVIETVSPPTPIDGLNDVTVGAALV